MSSGHPVFAYRRGPSFRRHLFFQHLGKLLLNSKFSSKGKVFLMSSRCDHSCPAGRNLSFRLVAKTMAVLFFALISTLALSTTATSNAWAEGTPAQLTTVPITHTLKANSVVRTTGLVYTVNLSPHTLDGANSNGYFEVPRAVVTAMSALDPVTFAPSFIHRMDKNLYNVQDARAAFRRSFQLWECGDFHVRHDRDRGRWKFCR